MKVHYSERDTKSLPPHLQTTLKQTISTALKLYGQPNCEVNLTIVTPAEITKLNNQYRNKNEPTDVLSFPGITSGHKPLISARRRLAGTKPARHLGDIVICLEVAQNQANEYAHSLERELAFLTAHGLLHLIGYDHNTPGEEAAMIEAQKQILAGVGINR